MEQFEQHLMSVWKQGSRDVAVSFLQRVVTPDITLSELLAALQFDGVQEYLDDISLRDVFRMASSMVASPQAMLLPPRIKRKRRSAEEMQQMKTQVLGMLTQESGTLSTSQVCAALQATGHDVDTVRANLVLKGLEKEGLVTDLGGKPKSWRAQTPGKRAAEPVLIKKKQAS
jgi:hypothetical protein